VNPAIRIATWQILFWFSIIAVLYVFAQQAQVVLIGGAILWAMRSPYHGVQALTVALLATIYNDGTAPVYGQVAEGSPTVTALRLAVIAVVFIRVVIERFRRSDHPPDLVLSRALLLGATGAAGAYFTSPILDVSLFKITLFSIGLVTVSLATSFAAQDRKDALFLWYWSWFAAVVVASAPLLVLPVGYAVNNTGFQGWVAQPQAAGLMFAPMVLFFGGLGLFDRLWPRLNIGLGSLALVEAFATLSRNAILAVVIGIAVGVFISYLRDARRWSIATFIGMTAGLLLVLQPATQGFIADIVAKGSTQSDFSNESAFQRSRGVLVEASWGNFLRHPVLGAGFGIATDPSSMVITRDPLIGLPVSAPSEKGVTWVAMLEEIGLLGTFVFALFLLPVLRGTLASSTATGFAVAVTTLMTGNGEAALFSFGGLGLFMWMVIFFAHGEGRANDG
jgi:hypothetical protein